MILPPDDSLIEEPSPGLRQRKRELRIEQILASSRHVFSQQGYANYSMRKVAEHAGVHLNTVQHFFRDLDSLLHSTVLSGISRYTDRYREVADLKELTPQQRLEAIIDENIRDTRDMEVQAFFTETWAAGIHNKKISKLLADLYVDYEDTLTRLILEMAPDRSPTEARIEARLMAAWMEGFALTMRSAPSTPPFGVVAARLKTMCLTLFGTLRTGASDSASIKR